jgi:hypothetical protein
MRIKIGFGSFEIGNVRMAFLDLWSLANNARITQSIDRIRDGVETECR